jgi:protoporphyrinogen oxidase
VIIIGAGLTGLACARQLGKQALVIESAPEVGGSARTYRRGGFLFDVTGHWLHLGSDEGLRLVRGLMDGELERYDRRAGIYAHGVRTAYPFQAHTFGLPPAVVADCLLGFFAAREARARGSAKERTFEDFIRSRLGDGIAKHFMLPYNTKLWTVPPAAMDSAWCERFVPQPTPEEVVWGALQPAGAGRELGYNAHFYYPKSGGIGRLVERLRAQVESEVATGVAVRAVDWRRQRLTLATGVELGYRSLVSTMPLCELVRCLVAPPDSIRDAAAELRAASVTYWDVGLAAPNGPQDLHWTYYPEPALPFYRAGAPSAVARHLVPAGCRSLYVELSHPRGSPPSVTDDAVLAALREVGLVGEHEQPRVWQRSTIDCAYVIMDQAYGRARSSVLDWLQSQKILSVGRYGGWTYDSMEDALLAGTKAAPEARARLAGAAA